MGAFYIVQARVNINVFFTVFLWPYRKTGLWGEEGGEKEISRASADGRHG